MAAGARELFRVVSCEAGAAWSITGIAPGSTPRRIWIEVEEAATPDLAVAELFDRIGIPSNTAAGEGSTS